MESSPGQRVDQWLDVACVFKTRGQAQTACKAGKVDVNGQRVKPHRLLREGDEIRITRPGMGPRILKVVGFSEQHVPKAEARKLYDDLTPAPTPEELTLRRMARQGNVQREPGAGAPSKKERRELRKLRGR